MVPDLNLGVVVLTNQLSTGAYWAIINHILDYNMKAEPFDWLAGYKKEWDASAKRRDSLQKNRRQLLADSSLRMSLPLEKYAGVFKDDLIGHIEITKDEKGLSMTFVKSPHYNADLVHFHGDLFRAYYKNKNMGEGPFLSFSLNPDRTVREAKFISTFSNADRDLEDLVLKPDQKAILDTTTLRKRIKAETDQHQKAGFGIAFLDLQTKETFLMNDKLEFSCGKHHENTGDGRGF